MKSILCFILLCTGCFGLYAQESNSKLLKKLVEKEVLTQNEADQIVKESESPQKQQSVEEAIAKTKKALNTPYLKFGGYGLLTYKYNQFGSNASANNHHDFRPRVVFVSLNGKLTNTISYGILAELVDPSLFEYYGEWTPNKFFNLKAGQFKVPFSIENPISLTNLETIYNTRSISSLAGMADDVIKLDNKTNGAGRDIGIQVSGSAFDRGGFDFLEYRAGMFQGSGINIIDPNNKKDFSGMLLLQPVKGLRMGGGAYFGQTQYKKIGEEVASDHVRNRWIASSEYESERFYARAEWTHGNDGGIEKEGLYGTALYYVVPKKLNFVGKVDYFNKDKNVNNEVMDYTLGVNYYFYSKCRLQVNYTYSDYSDKWGARNTNMVAAQMQVVF